MVRPDDASYAEIRIKALLKLIKDINNCVSNDIDLMVFPWDWKQYLSPFPPAAPAAMFNRTFPR